MSVIIANIIIPDKGAPCNTWVVYFAKLKQKFGKENAKIIWMKTWQVNGSTSCTTDPGFNKFLKKNGIDISSAAAKAISDISKIGSNFLGMGKSLSKALSVGVPATLGLVILLILYFLFKAAKDGDISDLAALTPQGRALKLLK